jgi:hypothetical protein
VRRGEAAVFRPLADRLGRAPVDGGHPLERGAAALAGAADDAGDLIADPQVVLADEALADVQIPAGREVAGFAPAKEPGAAMRDLEDAEGL